jgi:outer membrane protein TolC
MTRALTQRRDIAAAAARQRSAEADVEVARRNVFPGFALRVLGGFGQATGQWDVGVGVAMTLPVIDRGQYSIPASEARARAASESTAALQLETRQRVEAAYREAQQRLTAYTRFASETAGMDSGLTAESEAQFREGRLSVLELVDAITTANRVTVRRLELMRDLRLAVLRLRRLVEVGDST